MSVSDYNTAYENTLNTPLIIMDGFEISLTRLLDYNDNDIQSINILKDAAATAIYGSRGANGVIVIVSKQPQAGRLKIYASAGVDLEIADLSTYDLLNAKELFGLQTSLGLYNPSYEDAYNRAQQAYISRLKDIQEGVDTDWLHYPIRTGVTQRYSARIEGGNDEFRWGTSLGYNRVEGAMKDSKRNTFNGGITLSYRHKNVLFQNQLNITVNKGIESPYGSFSSYANMPGYYRPYDDEGNPIKSYISLYPGYSGDIANPLYDATLPTINESNYNEITNNFSIEWTILDGLYVRGRLGISHKNSESDYFLPPSHSTFNAEEYRTDAGYFRRGSYDYNTGRDTNIDGSLTLNYSKTFNEKHQFYAGLDLSIQQRESRQYRIRVEGFADDNAGFYGNAAQYRLNAVPYGTEATTRGVGLTANANYTYDSRYYVDVSYRVDGNSQFGADKRFAPFWSAGAGWSIHNEEFLRNSMLINTLRLRTSYGTTGSQNFDAYQAQAIYGYFETDKYLNSSGAYLIGIANSDLTWQETNQFDVGIDAGLWNNRLQVSVDYYIKTTVDLLSSLDLPRSTGYSSFADNIGKVRNTGFETSLSGYVFRNPAGWSWLVSGKLAYNKNEVLKLSESIKEQTRLYREQDVEVSNLFYEGYSQNSLWAVRSLGIDPSTGNELYLDADGKITTTYHPGAKVYCGISEPKFRGNLSTMLRWKNLSLNLSFGYHWGGQVNNSTLRSKVEVSSRTIATQNVDKRVLDARWQKAGDVTFFKRITSDSDQYKATKRFIMDDNVFQLQSASLQYRLEGAKFMEKMNIQSLTISVNSSDLFYLSSVKRERGTSYPFARRVGMSLAVQF